MVALHFYIYCSGSITFVIYDFKTINMEIVNTMPYWYLISKIYQNVRVML